MGLIEDVASSDPGVVRQGEAEGQVQEVEEGVVTGQQDHHHHHYLTKELVQFRCLKNLEVA